MGTEPPTKPVKLRESCDSCLQAKVKCSKSRPLCSRCLANGAPCDYSPSSRSGKRNRSSNTASKNSVNTNKESTIGSRQVDEGDSAERCHAPDSVSVARLMYPMLSEDDKALLSHSQTPLFDEIPSQSSGGVPGVKLSGIGCNSQANASLNGANSSELLPTPPFSHVNFGEPFTPLNSSQAAWLPEISAPSTSTDDSANCLSDQGAWQPKSNPYFCEPHLQGPLDLMQTDNFNPANRTPVDPSSALRAQPHHDMYISRQMDDRQLPCDCFAVCLQVLQSLHNHSMLISASQHGNPPFDVVLTINREAINTCSHMLGCTHCVLKSGKSISTMMLATIFGKVISLYRATCHSRIEPPLDTNHTSVQLTFGAYTVTGENRQLLEIEILLLELRKLERTLQRYSERFHDNQSSQKEDEAGVYGALTAYLDVNLQQILDFLQARKREMQTKQ